MSDSSSTENTRRSTGLAVAIGFLSGIAVAILFFAAFYSLSGSAEMPQVTSGVEERLLAEATAKLDGQAEQIRGAVERLEQLPIPSAAKVEPQASDDSFRDQLRQFEIVMTRMQASLDQLIEQQTQRVIADYELHVDAGYSKLVEGKNAEAIDEYTQALAVNPKGLRAYLNRGMANQQLGNWGAAIRDFRAALELRPENHAPWNNLAWLFATCPDDSLRNGEQAVEHAKQACELTEWKDYSVISTLAAAFAESGDFESAIMRHQEAIDMAPDNVKESLQGRLALYESSQPMRMKTPDRP